MEISPVKENQLAPNYRGCGWIVCRRRCREYGQERPLAGSGLAGAGKQATLKDEGKGWVYSIMLLFPQTYFTTASIQCKKLTADFPE